MQRKKTPKRLKSLKKRKKKKKQKKRRRKKRKKRKKKKKKKKKKTPNIRSFMERLPEKKALQMSTETSSTKNMQKMVFTL